MNEFIYLHIDLDAGKSYYQLDNRNSEQHKFASTVDTSTNVIHYAFDVVNIPDLKMPQTGGVPQSGRYQKAGELLVSTALIMMSCYLVFVHRKKRKTKEER